MAPIASSSAPTQAASGQMKILYGDSSRAEGLMNMMSRVKQLTDDAQQFVSANNPSLEQ